MANLKDVGNYFTSQAFLSSIIIAIIALFVLSIIKKYLIKKVAYTTKGEQHANTFFGVVFNLMQYAVVLITIAIILRLNGINVTSIIAGLGIVATLVGLALQDTMKDLISGVNIYNNNFYKVGDCVKYNGEICDVKYFSARVTKLQSLMTGDTYTVCNSNINAIEKVKDRQVITMHFDFEDDQDKIDEAFNNAAKAIEGNKYVSKQTYVGLGFIDDKGLLYIHIIFCSAHKSLEILADFYKALYNELKRVSVVPSFDDEIKVKENPD